MQAGGLHSTEMLLVLMQSAGKFGRIIGWRQSEISFRSVTKNFLMDKIQNILLTSQNWVFFLWSHLNLLCFSSRMKKILSYQFRLVEKNQLWTNIVTLRIAKNVLIWSRILYRITISYRFRLNSDSLTLVFFSKFNLFIHENKQSWIQSSWITCMFREKRAKALFIEYFSDIIPSET